nr:restriction endonuclease subunit S [Pectobacterium sp. PL152]
MIVKDGATTGKVSYVSSDFPFERAAINEHLFALTVDSAIAHPRYVFSFLKSPQGQKEILKDFRGAAIGGISRGFAKLAKIPLPSPNDQIRIVHLLDKVEGLIAQRKQHLRQLDELLKSVFLEMFGDPVRNEKGWNNIQFSELLAEIESGKSPKCEARRAEPGEWGCSN